MDAGPLWCVCHECVLAMPAAAHVGKKDGMLTHGLEHRAARVATHSRGGVPREAILDAVGPAQTRLSAHANACAARAQSLVVSIARAGRQELQLT